MIWYGPRRHKVKKVWSACISKAFSAVHVWCWVLSLAKSVQSDCQIAHNFFPFQPTFSARFSAKLRGSSKFTLFAWWTLCWQPACVTLDMTEFLQQAQLRFPGFDAIDVIAVQYITSKYSKKQQKITQTCNITSYGKKPSTGKLNTSSKCKTVHHVGHAATARILKCDLLFLWRAPCKEGSADMCSCQSCKPPTFFHPFPPPLFFPTLGIGFPKKRWRQRHARLFRSMAAAMLPAAAGANCQELGK